MARRLNPLVPALVLALAGACGSGGSKASSGSTSSSAGPAPTAPTATTALPGSTSTTLPLASYRTFGTVSQLTASAGTVAAASADGKAVDIRRPDASRQVPDCQGTRPADALYWVSLVGGAGEQVMSGTEQIAGDIVRGPAGKVAVFKPWASDGCPGYQARVYVGTESADGRLHDLKLVTGTGTSLENLMSLAWSIDGGRFVSFQTGGKQAAAGWPVVAIDPSSGAITKLFDVAGPVTAVAPLANGSYAVDHGGTVTVNDGTGAVQQTFPGFLAAVSPDHAALVLSPAATPGPVVLVPAGQSSTTTLFTLEAKTSLGRVSFSPDGRAVAYSVSVGATGTRLAVLTLADRKSADSPTPGSGPVFTGTGRALVFTVASNNIPAVLPLGT